MGQSVDVVVSELHSAAARLEDAAQRLRDGLSSVDTETTQLLGSAWKGGAASAYAPAWEHWHAGAEQVIEGLQRMSELLTIAGREYAKTDEAGADAVGSTVQGSGGSGASGDAAGAASGAAVGGGQGAAGGGNQTVQSQGAAQQAMSSASQLGQAAAQPLTQAGQGGQGAAGLVQQAMLLATTLAELAAEPDEDDPDEPEAGAAPGERPAEVAPTESRRGDEATRAVERPSE